ncbi:glucose-1-phosphate cytidylyltransferase [Xanthobacter sediminis]|uniref:glucose-1-phosphate cytidylyltransferase n=1 Tax=Xanthobacter sediminis TaxID=3119926 RepID=UPI00372A0901
MKAVILAGGLGTRLSEETLVRPKPMVEIGGYPILWHIMKIYSHHGIHDFVICLGYKGYMIKEYFANYARHMSDITVDLRSGSIEVHRNDSEPWSISLIDTGENTMTGGRLRRVLPYVKDEDFCLTYGDGVSDVDIGKSIAFHRAHGGIATVTATYPPKRFGHLDIVDGQVRNFKEKPDGEGGFINGGFFVLSPDVERYLPPDDGLVWEREPLETLSRDRQLYAFEHTGFWQPMDTLRDKTYLEELWASRTAPWKVWG